MKWHQNFTDDLFSESRFGNGQTIAYSILVHLSYYYSEGREFLFLPSIVGMAIATHWWLKLELSR